METQVQQSGGGGGGGGEVRRVHIIYFLSRKGRVEHPHLVRVHHLSRNGGVRLRDVKRWLSELRGKDMPDSFAWSYKRKYKAGYVWQDLLDEDLITPISDNEYVLKGSEIASSTFINDKYSYGDKDVSTQKKSRPDHEVEGAKEQKTLLKDEKQKKPDSPLGVSTKTSFEIEEESSLFGSETSSLTDDSSSKHEKDKLSNRTRQEEENGQRDEKENNTGYAAQNKNKKGDNVNNSSPRFKMSSPPTPNSSRSNPSIGKSSSYSGGPSHMFRNWITCGTVDTNESAVMALNRRVNRPSLGAFSNKENSKKSYKGAICKEEKLGGSERIAARSWLLEQQHGDSGRKSFDEKTGSKKSKTDEFNDRKTVSSAYKPVNRPKCSQCGRQFKPEKLHTHMKSCRGMRAMAKTGSASPRTSEKTQLRTADAPCHDSVTSFYLTNK